MHPEEFNKDRVKGFCTEHKLRYYSHKVHLGAFAIPQYMLDALETS